MGERLVDPVERQQVRDMARALDREDEALGRLLVPLLVVLRPLQRIERAVDLHRREMPGAELELAALRQARGIEDLAPGLVAPAGNTDSGQANFSFFHPSSFFTRPTPP